MQVSENSSVVQNGCGPNNILGIIAARKVRRIICLLWVEISAEWVGFVLLFFYQRTSMDGLVVGMRYHSLPSSAGREGQ